MRLWIDVLAGALGAIAADALSRSIATDDRNPELNKALRGLVEDAKKEEKTMNDLKLKMPCDLGSNVCKHDFTHIMDLEECKYILGELDYTYSDYYKHNPRADRPTGCIWHTDGNGYFNPTGKTAAGDQAPVCKPPEPPYVAGAVINGSMINDLQARLAWEKANLAAEKNVHLDPTQWAKLGESEAVTGEVVNRTALTAVEKPSATTADQGKHELVTKDNKQRRSLRV